MLVLTILEDEEYVSDYEHEDLSWLDQGEKNKKRYADILLK